MTGPIPLLGGVRRWVYCLGSASVLHPSRHRFSVVDSPRDSRPGLRFGLDAHYHADVVELVDTHVLGACDFGLASSSLAIRIVQSSAA